MFRSCQIIIRELRSLLKLYYSIHNSIHICKQGVVPAYHVVWEQHIPTQHDMLPQHLVCKDRNMSECFKVFYVKLYVHSLVDKLK